MLSQAPRPTLKVEGVENANAEPRKSHVGDGTCQKHKVEKAVAKIVSPRSDIRNRIKDTMTLYPGIKDHGEVIKKKCQEGNEKFRATDAAYWAWQKKMTAEAQPRWKMPADSEIGRRPVQEEILEKVEKAQRAMDETAANYKAWVKDMEKKRAEQLQTNVVERQKELKNYAVKCKARQAEIDLTLAGDKEKRAQQAGRYWTWLADTKTAINKREVTCAPFTKPSGAKSVEELTNMRRAQSAAEMVDSEREYSAWIQSIRKSKSKLPWNKECNSVEQRDAIINQNAKKGIEKLKASTAEYTKWVQEVEQAHHERCMQKVKEKLDKDKEFFKAKDAAAGNLRQKMMEEKKKAQIIAQASQREVREMYERVQSKPLLVEQAYKFGKFV